MAGRMIVGINCFYSQDRDGVTPEKWAAKAVFTWTLNPGTMDQPGPTSSELVKVRLSSDSSLRTGNWSETTVEWPVYAGVTYWLVGHWHDTASFVRLGSNAYCIDAPLAVGYKSDSVDEWQQYTNGGLMVEVTHSNPDQGTPAGILDPETTLSDSKHAIHAGISSDGLTISLDPLSAASTAYLPFNLLVVNTLGQTVVSEAGMADFGQIRIPWSADRPSGVYFCRIRLGQTSYTVPVVNLK
jgi:hypothetical protein